MAAKKDDIKSREFEFDTSLFKRVLASLPIWKKRLDQFLELKDAIEPDCQEMAKKTEELVFDFFSTYEFVKEKVADILSGKGVDLTREVMPDEIKGVVQKVANTMAKLQHDAQ